jgi:hypothetical protein
MIRHYLIPVLLLVILSFTGTAQTKTNLQKLSQLSEQFAQDWTAQQERVQDFAARNNVEIRFETPEGVLYQMVDVQDGIPLYLKTDNYGAAVTTRTNPLWEGGTSGLNLSGAGYDKLGVWDGGKVRVSHQEFTDQGASRITQMDNTSGLNFHATHVAGTMVAGGVVIDAHGMAYAAEMKAWDWTNALSEMTSAAATGLEISNHSYGVGTGWEQNGSSWTWYGNSAISATEDHRFGFYEVVSRSCDIIAFNAPHYLIVTSAGNERGEGPGNAGVGGNPEIDGGLDGFDCIGGHYAIAKNTLAVGAVKEVPEYTGPESVLMTSFSSWGPADDGRVKPDVVGKGQNVYSSLETSNSAYGSLQGTSMAAPNVAGSLGLLQQHYQNLNGGDPMLSSTLKGLTIHTADEAGPAPGPDYMFGWGLVNTTRAALIISDDQGQEVIEERVLNEGNSYVRELNVPEGTEELRVTLCWTDPAAIPAPAQLDPLIPMLVNDLDLRIENAGGTAYYPYSLDPTDPTAPATNDEKNNVDNVELITILQPEPGIYTLTVEHDGDLTNGEQAYSLIITGIDEYEVAPECASALLVPQNGDENVLVSEFITWTPANFASSYDVYFGTDGNGTTTPTNIFNGENVPANGFTHLMELNTPYYLQVVPRNAMGAAEDCNDIWMFTTMDGISSFPYEEDIENAVVPGLPEFWSAQNFSEIAWESTDLTAHSGSNAMACFNSDGLIETDMDNWFISPPFAVEGYTSYPLSFYYRNFIPDHEESLSVYWGFTPNPEDMTNMIFEASNFTGSGWQEATTNVAPGVNSVVFIGWHASSDGGYGIFLDDIYMDAGVAVSVEDPVESKTRIFASGQTIRVEAGNQWSGADFLVTNLMGQVVFQGQYTEPQSYTLNQANQTGLYFATLRKNGEVYTQKIVLTQ